MRHPNSISDHELKEYAEEHLQYEHDMLLWSAGILARLFPYQTESLLPWALVNGLLNTFAIHSRNLIDFLYSRREGKDYPTDIIIDDFVDREVIENHLAPISESLKEARVKANKQATHLTVDRIEYEKAGKEWKFIAIAEEIKRAFSSIAPHISNSRVSETLRRKLSEPRLSIPLMHVSTVLGKGGAKVGISLSLQAP